MNLLLNSVGEDVDGIVQLVHVLHIVIIEEHVQKDKQTEEDLADVNQSVQRNVVKISQLILIKSVNVSVLYQLKLAKMDTNGVRRLVHVSESLVQMLNVQKIIQLMLMTIVFVNVIHNHHKLQVFQD
jgi:hypothetical protein